MRTIELRSADFSCGDASSNRSPFAALAPNQLPSGEKGRRYPRLLEPSRNRIQSAVQSVIESLSFTKIRFPANTGEEKFAGTGVEAGKNSPGAVGDDLAGGYSRRAD